MYDDNKIIVIAKAGVSNVTATLTNQKNKSQTECVFKLIKIENKWYLQYVTVS